MSRPFPTPAVCHASAALLLAFMAWMADSSAAWKSPTFDETAGLVSGLAGWETGDARLDPENGLLPKRLAALPVWLGDARLPDFSGRAWELGFDWGLARDLLYGVGNDPAVVMRSARRMIVLMTVALGALVYLWSFRLFGPGGALISLWLTVFCPNLLAHGRLVTSDVAMSLLLPACLGATWWTFRRVTAPRLLACAAATGLLFLAKFAALVALPMLALLAALRAFSPEPLVVALGRERRVDGRGARLAVLLGVFAWTGLATAVLIWAAHGFAFRSDHGSPFAWNWARVESLGGLVPSVVLFARDLGLLPEAWLYGLGYTIDSIQSRVAFANGVVGTTGWWWFFPYAVLVKTPVGTLAIWALAAVASLASALRRGSAGADAFWRAADRAAPLWILLIVYWGSSLTSNINIGLRHVLPTYPAAMILAGAVARIGARPLGRAVLVLLLLATAAESWSVRPHYLAFFNRVAGGPEHGYRRLVDSNLDWGQDLPGLAAWLSERRARGDRTPCALSYFGSASPAGHGVDCAMLPGFFDFDRERTPAELHPGLYAVSATLLQGLHFPPDVRGAWTPEREERLARARLAVEGPLDAGGLTPARELFERLRFARLLAWLREREPEDRVGYSILIYRLGPDDLRAALEGPLDALGRAPGNAG